MYSLENFPGFFDKDELLYLSELYCFSFLPQSRKAFDLGFYIARRHSMGLIHGDLHRGNLFYDPRRHTFGTIDHTNSWRCSYLLFKRSPDGDGWKLDLTKLSPDIALVDLVAIQATSYTSSGAFLPFIAGYSKASQEFIDPITPGYTERLLQTIGGRVAVPYTPLPFHGPTHEVLAAIMTSRPRADIEALAGEINADERIAVVIAKNLLSVLEAAYRPLDELYDYLYGVGDAVVVHHGRERARPAVKYANGPEDERLHWSQYLQQTLSQQGESTVQSKQGSVATPMKLFQALTAIARTVTDDSRPRWVEFVGITAEVLVQLLYFKSTTNPLTEEDREFIISTYQVVGFLFQNLLLCQDGPDMERQHLYLRQLATFLRHRLAGDIYCWSACCKVSELTISGIAALNTEAYTEADVFQASAEGLSPLWSSAFKAREIFQNAAKHLFDRLGQCECDNSSIERALFIGKFLFGNYAALLQRMLRTAIIQIEPYGRHWVASSGGLPSIADEADLIMQIAQAFAQGFKLDSDLARLKAIFFRISGG